MPSPRAKRFGLGCLGVFVVGFAILYFSGPGKAFRDLWKHGVVQSMISSDDERKYEASSTGNLRSMYQAMRNYLDSEGQFPDSAKWMDEIASRGQASDLAEGEADKKFHDPSLAGGGYGYAMNDSASGKFYDPRRKKKDDFTDPKMPLIFTSSETARNAHGSPTKLAPAPPRNGNLAITVDGTIIRLAHQ